MRLLVHLALGNVRRSVRSYSVYFATLAFGACLIYSFCSTDQYLLMLTLTPEMEYIKARLATYIPPFGFFITLVFLFLVSYASRTLVRRRKREFALYKLMGMGGLRVGVILVVECAMVGAASLAAGLVAGIVLSPLFGAITAYAFDATWVPAFVVSPVGIAITVASFALVTMVATLAEAREVRRHGIASLMVANRAVEHVAEKSGRGQAGTSSLLLGLFLLGNVYLCCAVPVLQGVFLALLAPMCAAACLGTYLVIRYAASRVPATMRRWRGFYLSRLNCFVVRQVESRVRATCGVLSWSSALLAVGVCMVGMGVGFRVAVDLAPAGASPYGPPTGFAPVAYVGIYYGATFLVAAAAILAIQQVSEASENTGRYAALRRMGCSEGLLSRAVGAQVATYFLVPATVAAVHVMFGFAITGAIVSGFSGLAMGDTVGVLLSTAGAASVALLLYGVATFVACRREALSAPMGALSAA